MNYLSIFFIIVVWVLLLVKILVYPDAVISTSFEGFLAAEMVAMGILIGILLQQFVELKIHV